MPVDALNSIQIEVLIDKLPDCAKDLRPKYSTMIGQNTELSAQHLWGTLAGSALATRNAALTASVLADAKVHLSAVALEAAKGAAAIMGMNNTYGCQDKLLRDALGHQYLLMRVNTFAAAVDRRNCQRPELKVDTVHPV